MQCPTVFFCLLSASIQGNIGRVHVIGFSAQSKLKAMWDSLLARLEREEGQDMIEYALLAALISIVAIAIILLIGPYLANLFQDVVNALGTT